METKYCGRCERTLSVASFSKHRSRPDGLQAYCKECCRAANRRKEQEHRERPTIAEPTEKRCARCRETLPGSFFYKDRRRRDGLYSNCKVCHRKVTDGWKSKNPAAVARISRDSGKRNAEKRRAYSRAYHHANRAQAIERMRQYKRENRARMTALETVRRGRKAGAAGDASPEQIAARVAYYGGKCWMCRAPWEQIDHVKPIARGGPNWPSNLRPACKACNGAKNARWPLAA